MLTSRLTSAYEGSLASGPNRQGLQGFPRPGEGRNFPVGGYGIQILHIEQTVAGNAIELKADFSQTQTPAFQPHLEIPLLTCIAISNDDQIDVASDVGVSGFRAAKQVNRLHSESGGIDCTGNTLRESLLPAPVFRCRAQAFTAQFPLLPFEILTDG